MTLTEHGNAPDTDVEGSRQTENIETIPTAEDILNSTPSVETLIREFIEVSGYGSTDLVSVNHRPPGGAFRSQVVTAEQAPATAAQHATGDVWISKCPLRSGITSGRGTAADVVGIRNIWADVDVKPGGLPSMAEAHLVVREISQMLGVDPSVVVHSGNGLQPTWLLDSEDDLDFEPGSAEAREWAARMGRFGRLVQMVTEAHGGGADAVFDLSRIMRAPGTMNLKNERHPKPVTADYPGGAALTEDRLDEVLDAYSIAEHAEDRELLDPEASSPSEWTFAVERTCPYVTTMVKEWAKAKPTNRHGWFVGQAVRLAVAHRQDCITAADYESAREVLSTRFRTRLNTGVKRKETPGEVAGGLKWGITKASTFDDARAASELGDHEHAQPPKAAAHVAVSPVALDEMAAVVGEWLGEDYEIEVMHAAMAVAAASRYLPNMRTPPWLLINAGSGNAKTQTLEPLKAAPGAVMVSSISSEAALLSGSPDRERAADSTGGLLREVGDDGLLLIKDFTSILSLSHDTRKMILGAFREIFDGEWSRRLGVDGGRTIPWEGRVTVIGAVTSAWDAHHAVIAQMGDRFLIIRPSDAHAKASAISAARAAGREAEMSAELTRVVSGVMDNLDPSDRGPMPSHIISELIDLADVVTLTRTAVETDYKGEAISAHAREAPTRYLKQLQALYAGALLIGLPEAAAVGMCRRVAADTLPPLRREVLAAMLADRSAYAGHRWADDMGRPHTSVSRTIEQLWLLGLVASSPQSSGHRGWRLNPELDADTLAALAHLTGEGGGRR